MLMILLGISLTASVVLIIFLYYQTRVFAVNETEKKTRDLLIMHNAIHNYVTEHQKPAIYQLKKTGKLYEEYFSPEVLSSSFMTRNIHKHYSQLREENNLPKFYYKLAANNPRNPLNRADEFEEKLIGRFNRREITEFKTVIEQEGMKYLYFALPFTENGQACMKCHSTPEAAPKELVMRYGDKNGFYEKVGDIRAIISIRVPLDQEFAVANNVFTKLSVITFGTILLFFLGGLSFLYVMKINKPINKLTNAATAIAEGDLDHQIDTSGHDEFSILAKDFDLMRNSIKEKINYLNNEILNRKKAEEDLGHLFRELELKNSELEQVLYITSHDLRSPLVNVQGYTNEIYKFLEEFDSILQNEKISSEARGKIDFFLNKNLPDSKKFIKTSILKMDSLLSGILKVSRLGREQLIIEKLDMNKIISDVFTASGFNIKKAQTEFEVSDLPACRGDKRLINQVFSNLIENAIKYLDPQRKGIIKVSGKKEGGHSVYCVEDNGIGIMSDHQKKVFDIFHQLRPTESEGEGLGLTIAHRIIDKHGGMLWVESEPGKGSTFFVSLHEA
jgi:signal transduction histidine kinase